MNKRKILFFINSLYGGGAEKVFQTLLNHLDMDQYKVTVYSVIGQEINRSLYKTDFDYHFIFDEIKKEASTIQKWRIKIKNKVKLWIYHRCSPETFYKLFVKEEYDVEAAFIEGYATRIISGSNNKESKKIAWVHTDLLENPWTQITYKDLKEEILAYKKFDNVVCVSQDVASSFRKKYGNSDKITVQYNPVDEQEICRKANEPIHTRIGNQVRFVTIGRLVEQKGYDRLVRIGKKLKENNYKFYIHILGDGPLKQELSDFIDKNELNDYMKLDGFVHNPYPYIKQSDVFICSSRSEGFSTVVTEALILQKPVITTDCAGMKELFGQYECGIITENNEQKLYEAIRYLLEHPQKREHYKKQVIKRAEFFKLEKRMQEIRRILDE